MKILVVGDLHGQKPKIYFRDFDAIIAPGDFCSDAHRKYIFEALRRNIENPKKKFRWQTNKKIEERASEKLKDPTGKYLL